MPLSSIPGIPQDADLPRVVDYLIMLRRTLNDFLNHLDTLNVDELDAGVVNTGVLNANLVSVSAANGNKSLTIDTTGIKANNGATNTLIFDLASGLLTIVSALIQSSTGYPRVELNGQNSTMAAYKAADSYVNVNPNLSAAVPGIEFWLSAISAVMYLYNPGTPTFLISTPSGTNQAQIQITSALDLFLSAITGYVKVQNWNKLYSTGNSQDLQTALNGKANNFSGVNGTVYVAATSGGAATIPITFSNGVRTS